MTTTFRRHCRRCTTLAGAAATLILLAASVSDAQTTTRERIRERDEEFFRDNPCTQDFIRFITKHRVEIRSQQTPKFSRLLIKEHRSGPGSSAAGAVVIREYRLQDDFRQEEFESSEPFVVLELRKRTLINCIDNCDPFAPRGDDFFMQFRTRCAGPPNEQECRTAASDPDRTCR